MVEKQMLSVEEAHLKFAKESFNRIWELLGISERSRGENDEMVTNAHASLYHWLQVGTPLNFQRGQWMLAHVYTVLEQPASALEHALRCMELTESYHSIMADFDLAFAHECLARALALAGRIDEAQAQLDLAVSAGANISDPDDKEIFEAGLKSGPWFGLAGSVPF